MGKIMIIGAAIADILVYPAEPEVFTAGSYAAEQICMSTGGDALNEAAVLAQMGEQPYLCTLLGQDSMGEFIESYCAKNGISLAYSRKDPKIQTGINVVLVQKNGERSFLTNPSGTLRQLKKEHIIQPFPGDVSLLCLASIFVSPHLGNRELESIFRQARKQGICVCGDMTKRKGQETVEDMRDVFSYMDYLFANREEAALLTGKSSPEGMADAILKCGVSCVVIKCGSEGCFVKQRQGEALKIPGYSVPCVDTTGAGDSFAAGFLYGLSKGRDIVTCAQYGNACGALAVQQVGTGGLGISLEKVKEITGIS